MLAILMLPIILLRLVACVFIDGSCGDGDETRRRNDVTAVY